VARARRERRDGDAGKQSQNLHDDRRNEAVTLDDTKATLASFHRVE
jgi:hypothetical protein